MIKKILLSLSLALAFLAPAQATVSLTPLAKQQFNQLGIPLAGGKLYTYAAGTNTKLATYTDSTGTTPNTNPIILDSNGQADVWLTDVLAYKFVLSPSTDTDPPTNPFWTEDNIANVPNTNPIFTSLTVTGNAVISGNATVGTLNKITFTQPATSATLTIINGKTLTANNTLTFSGTDGSTLNVGTGGTLGTAAYTATTAYATAAQGTKADAAAVAGPIGSSLITMSTNRLLGRTTAATGAPEEITVGVGLSLSGGSLSSTTSSGLVLLSTSTPTAALNFDLLSVFTSTYDNYLIVGEGITPSATDTLLCRLASSGTVDSGSNYYMVGLNTSTTTAVTSFSINTVVAPGTGVDFTIFVSNANDAVKIKRTKVDALSQSTATPTFLTLNQETAYSPANAVSGFRLYWNGASNFGVTGKIKVYGYLN